MASKQFQPLYPFKYHSCHMVLVEEHDRETNRKRVHGITRILLGEDIDEEIGLHCNAYIEEWFNPGWRQAPFMHPDEVDFDD